MIYGLSGGTVFCLAVNFRNFKPRAADQFAYQLLYMIQTMDKAKGELGNKCFP